MTDALAQLGRFQTDVLVLLIGSNPLPNYVAARLLTQPQATVYLFATIATDGVAKRLARRLGQERSDLFLTQFTVPEADGPVVASKVDEIARQLSLKRPNASIGV